ncbi:MAG: DUF2399 domain-containing protein [Candidatus Binataceae bacterium]
MSTLKSMLAKGMAKVTKEFTKEKHKAAAATRGGGYIYISQAQEERLLKRKEKDKEKATIKTAAYEVMSQAYLLASANGTLPANARQIMYAARPLVLERTGGKCWEKSSYFTQTLLPEYIAEHPDETADWDVVYDARGHLVEPHVEKELGLGTLEVRSYVGSWRDGDHDHDEPIHINQLYPTRGPGNRYKFALFIEKEGFDHLLERAGISERFDIAIFSSKGMPTTATRQLVDALSQAGVTILIAHDFDISGLGIAYTLSHDTRRYTFKVDPHVIDLGLRLADVEAMNLQSEPVQYEQIKDPRAKFRDWDHDYDTTDAELAFLVQRHVTRGSWTGKRVELNAMTSDQFIAWLERKLIDAGVEKVVPDEETLVAAWRRASLIADVKEYVEMRKEGLEKYPPIPPADLESHVRELLVAQPAMSWDEALALCAERDDPTKANAE